MRECVFNAGLISNKSSVKLQFTTEPEAAAIYCMENILREHDLDISGTNFMIVDCGGGTVDLTTRQTISIWRENDPEERKIYNGFIHRFSPVARRGTTLSVDEEVTIDHLCPLSPIQIGATIQVYYTREYDARFCDEPGMELLGTLEVDLPDPHLGYERSITFGLKFGRMEITATAKNDLNGQNFQISFDIETEN
ncbi:unnamed protein product [Rhizophagus irregularis]|nr:unnamed protein product [Rhizophagus irregularis]